MMLARRHQPRTAFTLLEVMLAMVIGVLLMAALYVAVDVQLRHAQVARDVVEQSTLARALLWRMGNDIMPSLGAPLPVTTSSASGAGGAPASGTGTTAATGSGTTGSGTTSGTTSGGATSSNMPSSSTTTATASNAVVVNIGVQGDANRLTISVSRVPRDVMSSPDNSLIASDLRRVSYWLVNGGDQPLGLARMEIKPVTSDEATSMVPPDVPDEPTHIIAEEVKSLIFSYFDGSTWVDSWDGTQPGADGQTPKGPPLAIAIVIGVTIPGKAGEQALKYHRHVVAIPTANGATQPSSSSNGQ